MDHLPAFDHLPDEIAPELVGQVPVVGGGDDEQVGLFARLEGAKPVAEAGGVRGVDRAGVERFSRK